MIYENMFDSRNHFSKIVSSQSISTSNHMDSSFASKKRCRFEIRIVVVLGEG